MSNCKEQGAESAASQLSKLPTQTADLLCSNCSTDNTHISNKRRVFQPEMAVNRDLYMKCYNGEVEQVRQALASGADPNSTRGGTGSSTVLMAAILNNREEVVDLLLATDGIEVNKRGGPNNNTPLHTSCFLDRGAIIIKLLAAPGIDANALDGYNHTPIMHALDYGQTEAVRLMAPVADLDRKFPDGRSLEER